MWAIGISYLSVILSCCILAVQSSNAGATTGTTTIYVAPAKVFGSNVELGTIDAPFSSLEAARDFLRSGYGQNTRREILLRGGNYFLPKPFVLDERDAGTERFPIIYAAYPGESAQLSGGVLVPPSAISPASVPSGAANAFVADLFSLPGVNSSTLGRMGHPYISRKLEMFYGGQPMTLARDPNIGTDPLRTWKWAGYENMSVANATASPGPRRRLRAGSDIDCSASPDTMQCYLAALADVPELRYREGRSLSDIQSNTTFTFKDTDRGALWASAMAEARARNETAGMWLHGFWKYDWRDTYIQVASIVANKASAPKSQSPSVTSYSVTRAASTPPQYPWVNGCRFYAVNALGLLDAPGEYFVSTSGHLYFIPPDGKRANALQSVMVSTAANVITSEGAHHTHFVGLSLSVAQGTVVQLTDAVGAVVENCTVSNGLTACIGLSGALDASVNGSTVSGCGGSGVSVSGGDLKTLKHSHSFVAGNNIFDFARLRRTYQPGVAFYGVGLYVGHNTVEHAPHAGMTGGGNDHLFEFNVIRNTVFESIDAGAFYVGRSWSQRGNIFRNNIIDTVRSTERLAQASCSQNGFYLDDQMSGWLFTGNHVINATTGVLLGGGRRNTITNNLFTDCDADIHFDDRGLNWEKKSCQVDCSAAMGTSCFHATLKALNWQHPPYATHYPEIVNIYHDRPCTPVYNVIEDNTWCHTHSKNGGKFCDHNASTVSSWGSTMKRNKKAGKC